MVCSVIVKNLLRLVKKIKVQLIKTWVLLQSWTQKQLDS